MLGSLGHRVHAAAVDFASWAPSTGVLLLLVSIIAVLLVNSPLGPRFHAFWQAPLGLEFADARFRMSLLHWVNDGLLTVFFLVVGLEIKREFTVGHLASPRSAALPIAAAIGGMAVPAALYALLIPAGPWGYGWGVPMATDTAFAVALIVMLGKRVPRRTARLPHRGVDRRRHRRDRRRRGVLLGCAALGLPRGGRRRGRAVGAAQSLGRLPADALRVAGPGTVGVRARGRSARDARGCAARVVHPDAATAQSQRAGCAGQRRPHRRDGARAGSAAARTVDAGVARARCDPRPPRIAGGPHAARDRALVELPRAAGIRARQCRRRVDGRRVRGTRGADLRDRARARVREAARLRRRTGAGRLGRHRAETRRLFVAAAAGCGRARGDRLHDVIVHRGSGHDGAGRFRRGEDRGVRRVDPVRGHRRGIAVAPVARGCRRCRRRCGNRKRRAQRRERPGAGGTSPPPADRAPSG